ncbi:histidine kinase [Lewinellaceae bacterium SD302]|nr:histidine kinase [Lewinellaceae bacterium SD302]
MVNLRKYKKAALTLLAISAITPVLVISHMVIFTNQNSIELTFNSVLGSLVVLYYLLLIIVGVSTSIYWLIKQVRAIIQLKKEKTKIELLHLKAQVNPHFFFNTLNNLYGWVGKDPDTAQRIILKLADMMRYSIYDGQKDFVLLADEVSFLKDYTDLHRMRYHKNVEVTFKQEITDECAKLTPLLFVILVENAFKHGVENLRQGAFVHLTLFTTPTDIRLKITNNVGEKRQGPPGIGLKNLRKRLELAYPRSHRFTTTLQNNVFTADLTIPRL